MYIQKSQLRLLFALALIATALCNAPVAQAQQTTPPHKTAHVAVFAEAGFPTFLFDDHAQLPPPNGIVARFRSLGIEADTVDAASLADSARFNPSEYTLLVLPYGNCYPQAALQNLQTFHREGGYLVVTGVPFTHAVIFEPGVPEGWAANPGWGELVHTLPGKGPNGQNAIEIKGSERDWQGGNTPRFPVQPGTTLETSAWVRDDGRRPEGSDWLFLRFYDKVGNFLGQEGVEVPNAPEWTKISRKITVPAKAATADISPQVFNHHRALLFSDMSATADGRPNPAQNGSLLGITNHWRDIGDQGRNGELFGAGGVGVGTFAGPDGNLKPYVAAPDDPLHLHALGYTWRQTNLLQWLDPATLPEEDTIIPFVGTRLHPLAALVIHHDADCHGAIDAWVYMGPDGEHDIPGSGQMIVRGTIAALAQGGYLSPARAQACYTALDRTASTGKTL